MAKTRLLGLILASIAVVTLVPIYIFEWSKMVAPGSSEAAEVETAIVYGYEARAAALQNGGDVSAFDLVFIDTPDFQLKDEEDIAFVERVLGPGAAASAGYLSALKAEYQARGCGVKLMEEAHARALQEDRSITEDEYDAITDQCYGVETRSVMGSLPYPRFKFLKIKIDGDRATVVYEYSGITEKATLVRQEGR